eukprot:TRINITY_DN54833_c0_g1_i1.p3 TRINITY_DN54833_c0_g1~~TRINITY_DN54833_c0_g1_i1.p3  ORF type:complete len:124 (-),score=25.93 TRINITY_DN54833_c0_g1_i1:3-323(-)
MSAMRRQPELCGSTVAGCRATPKEAVPGCTELVLHALPVPVLLAAPTAAAAAVAAPPATSLCHSFGALLLAATACLEQAMQPQRRQDEPVLSGGAVRETPASASMG